MVPTIYGLLMLLFGFFVSGQGIVYMAIITTLFGATAAAFATALGGANITPAMVGQGFVGLNLLRKEGLRGFLKPVEFGSPAFWLLLVTLWGVASAFILPRFFEGQFLVSSFDRDQGEGSLALIKPVSLNITQAMYAFLAFMTFIMMRTVLSRPGGSRAAAKAVCWAAGLNIIAASLGLVQHYAAVPIIDYIKNANYAMMGGEVAGLVRVTGTFSETSAFSQYTLALIGFTHTLWMFGLFKAWARVLTLGNLALLLISTSGTAYVGLAICMAMAITYALWRLFRRGTMGPYSLYVKLALFCLILGIGAVLFIPKAWTLVSDFFGVVIGQKLDSESGSTRQAMNVRAFETFLNSFGFGGGLGCCRASSFAFVLISNVGWIGTALFLLFLGPILLGRLPQWASDEDKIIAIGARRAIFAALITALLVGLVYDLGFMFYIMAALAFLPKRPPQTTRVDQKTT